MKPDIFDRIMSARIFKPLNPFYTKYKEQLLYLFFGALTTFLNIGVFALFVLYMDPLAANVIAWIIAVLFAYVTNRIWVFQSKARGTAAVGKEAVAFLLGRLATLGLEELMIWLGIDVLGFATLPVKIVTQIAVIIGNYLISKLIVFRRK